MKSVALICARGGSKGLPGKNIKLLNGKPLIAWAIEQALAVTRISRVIVSTDSEEIAAIARSWGAQVPFIRPPELAGDDSPEWLVWQHALGYLRDIEGGMPDVMVVVPTTAPLRISTDIDNCLDVFERSGSDMVITVTDAHRSPYFNMVRQNSDGTVGLVIPSEKNISRRQDAPPVFDITTVAYVARPDFILSKSAIFEGEVSSVHIPPERAIDIDTLLDFRFAEMMFAERARSQSA
jgi:CMP-N-acetylneuraminic acid synthetase